MFFATIRYLLAYSQHETRVSDSTSLHTHRETQREREREREEKRRE